MIGLNGGVSISINCVAIHMGPYRFVVLLVGFGLLCIQYYCFHVESGCFIVVQIFRISLFSCFEGPSGPPGTQAQSRMDRMDGSDRSDGQTYKA